MNKLKLNLDDLAVTSFETDVLEEATGTVHGAADTDGCTVSCGDPFSALYRYYRRLMTYPD